jgi:hypothetical protein
MPKAAKSPRISISSEMKAAGANVILQMEDAFDCRILDFQAEDLATSVYLAMARECLATPDRTKPRSQKETSAQRSPPASPHGQSQMNHTT